MDKEITIKSDSRTELKEITGEIQKIVKETGIKNGICYLFVPHTTAGITINEHADPSVVRDILNKLNELVPYNSNYHHTEGNADSHIKASIVGTNQVVFVENGRLNLGTWQGIFFCEFDGPRRRKVLVKVV